MAFHLFSLFASLPISEMYVYSLGQALFERLYSFSCTWAFVLTLLADSTWNSSKTDGRPTNCGNNYGANWFGPGSMF